MSRQSDAYRALPAIALLNREELSVSHQSQSLQLWKQEARNQVEQLRLESH